MKEYLLLDLNIKLYPGKFRYVIKEILNRIHSQQEFIVLPFSLNDLAAAISNPTDANAFQQVDICTTDGMPIVWWCRFHKIQAERVYGPDIMREISFRTQGIKIKHFLLGSSPIVLKQLQNELKNIAPRVNIVGSLSPPYTKLVDDDLKFIRKTIAKTEASIVWIGISSPKQVLLATALKKILPKTSFFCVGAAFDIVSKTKPMAPKFIQSMGLEWLFRLSKEPGRLWKRYLVDIPLCLVLLTKKKISSLLSF